jgi:succinate dehydrogenase / fumarate reductase, cytochrome b subunit
MASTPPRPRPLSPHLQVYRWGPHMAASIINRITGVGLSIAGVALLLWWLGAAAYGPEAYATFRSFITHWFGRLVLIGISLFFFQHMLGGIRHFFMDAGHGYDLAVNRRVSILTFVGSIALTALVWVIALFL